MLPASFPLGRKKTTVVFGDQKALNFDQKCLASIVPLGTVHPFLASSGLPSGVLGFKSKDFCALNTTVAFFLPSGKLAGSICPSLGTLATRGEGPAGGARGGLQ